MKTRSNIVPPRECDLEETMAPVKCDPPKLLVLPEDRNPEARIYTLAHPRTLNPSQYYVDPEKGIYEFTRIAAPKSLFRSWLIAGRIRGSEAKDVEANAGQPTSKNESQDVDAYRASRSTKAQDVNPVPIFDGYIIKDAEILVATPIDYLFLLIPSFVHTSLAKSPSTKSLFLSADDLLEKLSDESKHFHHLLSLDCVRRAMEVRMQVICDTVEAGDEKMYRLNIGKLLDELLHKARQMIARGLPKSMEERFVRKVLERPIMVIKREESSVSDVNVTQNGTPISERTSVDVGDSQKSSASCGTAESAASVNTELTIPEDIKSATDDSELYHLLRMRTALLFMISVYIHPALAANLQALLASEDSPINFRPLDERLAQLAKMRAEALAARSLGDFSRKRSMYEEDDAVESRTEKKQRKEEEEKKKKAGENRSIRDLKKVDTKGMKKMSDFFGKGAASKKK